MAFKMSGFSAFTKTNEDLPPQDPPSGRSKLAELRHDMQSMEKEIERFTNLAKDDPANCLLYTSPSPRDRG